MEGWWGDSADEWSCSTYSVQVPKPKDPIETATDDVLILELIKRGYAVAKMPADKLAEASE